MQCPRCGASLRISQDLKYCTCSYCGSQLNVIEEGGIVALREIAKAIEGVNETTLRSEEKLDGISSKIDQIYDSTVYSTVPIQTFTDTGHSDSGSGCAVVIMVASLLVFLFFIAWKSGIDWALIWAPFVLFGLWSKISCTEYLPVSLWSAREKLISGVFILWMAAAIAAILAKCS